MIFANIPVINGFYNEAATHIHSRRIDQYYVGVNRKKLVRYIDDYDMKRDSSRMRVCVWIL